MEKILKETYVQPKIELRVEEYNNLVDLARMKAKKIEERARAIYEKEGVVRIEFEGNINRRRYGELERDKYKFECRPFEYHVSPSGDFEEKPLFRIPQELRGRIAQKVGRYVEEVFEANFGEHLYHLNEIKRIEAIARRERNRFIGLTIVGWAVAVIMILYIFLNR